MGTRALFAEECFVRSKIMEEQRRWAIDALRLKARVDDDGHR
jgi:hypothetical protein